MVKNIVKGTHIFAKKAQPGTEGEIFRMDRTDYTA